ncbi:MAG: hypothetical protein M3Y18_08980, partial [Candidatus Eremiobacteraeota bacterium]|nr:hypothetical protein [Candidatus Eremiobacteraeota bacterium]
MKSSADIDDAVNKVREQFLPLVRKAAGFASYSLAVTDGSEIVSAGFFTDRKGADESADLARTWVTDTLGQTIDGPPKVSAGDVLLSDRMGGHAGFGVLRRMKLKAGKGDAALDVIRGLLAMLKEVPGFVSGAVIAPATDELLVIGAYRDRASSEEATTIARP